MKEKQKHELKVGLTVLIALVIISVGFFIVKEWSVSGNEYPLLIRFETSAGLQKGDIVTINGVKSGRVENVIVDGTSVLIRTMIKDEFKLTNDAHARIQMLELMGGKKIEITQGQSSQQFDRNKILIGQVDPDIAGALGVVGQMKGDILQLSTNANQVLINLNALLGDKQFQTSFKKSFVNLNQTMIELRGMISENRANAKTISTNIARLTAQLDTILTQTKPEIKSVLNKTNNTLMQSDSLFSEAKFLLRDIREKNSFLHQALYDSTFTAKVDTIFSRVNKLFDILMDNGMKVRIRL